jgi:CRP-like cAMP-binding protein
MFNLLLANFAMHITLDAAETERLTAQLQFRKVKKNEVLLSAGSICKHIYYVNKGCLRLLNRDQAGDEHNILFSPENWWVADMASFSAQAPAFYSISALEDSEVFYLSYTLLEQLYVDIPKLERFFRILTQNGFSLFQSRINSNLAHTAEERYARFKRQYPGLEQRIAQKQIAAYLGITPVFLSMIRKKKD